MKVPERSVDVDVSMQVVAEGESPHDARSTVASRVKEAIDGIEGKTPGVAVGTRGGEVVEDG